MPRARRSAATKNKPKQKVDPIPVKEFSDEDDESLKSADPTEDSEGDEERKNEIASSTPPSLVQKSPRGRVGLRTTRSRRAATIAKKNYVESDSDTATDSGSDDSEDGVFSRASKKANKTTNKRRTQVANQEAQNATKKRKKSTSKTSTTNTPPLMDIKNKRGMAKPTVMKNKPCCCMFGITDTLVSRPSCPLSIGDNVPGAGTRWGRLQCKYAVDEVDNPIKGIQRKWCRCSASVGLSVLEHYSRSARLIRESHRNIYIYIYIMYISSLHLNLGYIQYPS